MSQTQPMATSRLAGRVALVTGGARGMGAAFAAAFLAEGARVVITDRLQEAGIAQAAALGPGAMFLPHDVTSAAEWERVVRTSEQSFGAIGVLVNNAGVHDHGPIETFPEERYRRVVDINQLGVFLGMQAVIPSMRRAGGGSIVNMSSTAGLAGFTDGAAYVASKWAIRGMTKVAALELGADRIRVNSVHPGLITTPMTADYAPNLAQPIPRAGTAAEVAKLLVFLASDDSSYCTGGEFVIDGGQTSMVGTPPARPDDG